MSNEQLSNPAMNKDLESASQAGANPGFGMRILLKMLTGMKFGQLEVTLPNGLKRFYHGTEAGPRGHLIIRDERVLRRILLGGEVGFDEAYLDGWWDTPDLANLLQVLYLNEPHYLGPYEKNIFGRLYGYWQHRRRHNSKRNARKNIEAHYDLGNDFYKLWLDDTMTYSCAVFSGKADETLHEAQINKYKAITDRLELKPEHHILEIGSGWGGLAIYAAREFGCRVTSITLSQEQLEEARRRAKDAGVDDRVRFELRDYRDVDQAYDRVMSIEMYEAVGEKYWPVYFNTLSRTLKPGGRAAIQGITIDESIFDEYRNKQDFIQKHIFPGGMLATKEVFLNQARTAQLEVESPSYFGLHYADTLARWHVSVISQKDAIVRMFGERFYRMWQYYLAYCEAGFRVSKLDLMHVTLVRS